MRRISVVICDRANYGRLLPIMIGIRNHAQLTLSIVIGGSFVLDRFGRPWEMLDEDGFRDCQIDRVYGELEGNTVHTMAMSAGIGMSGYADAIARQRPDAVLMIGDRYQAVGIALATHLLGVCLIHVQGGEHTGHIDDAHRHAITQLANYHIPATFVAAKNICAMGVCADEIIAVGCPSSDLIDNEASVSGDHIVAVYHPSTDDDAQGDTMAALIRSLTATGRRVFVFWPNIDAGSGHIAKAIRRHSESLIPIKHMHPKDYLQLLSGAAVLVGNSSSFMREAGYWGVPVLLIGHRQDGREHGDNVVRVSSLRDLPFLIDTHAGSRFPISSPYFSPGVSATIVSRLAEVPLVAHTTRELSDCRFGKAVHEQEGIHHFTEMPTARAN